MNEGGKAAGLRLLAGFSAVPPFLVVPAEQAVDAVAVAEKVARSGLRAPYAVRSSADVEDGGDAAFAGMFRTRLRVTDAELPVAVADVASSLGSPRLNAYVEARASSLRRPCEVHVIVQEMVDAQVAGVCLTRLPESTGDSLAVEAVYGLGELLVSGAVEPDLYHVDRAGDAVTVAHVGNQALRLSLARGEELVPAHLRQARKLTSEQVQEVAKLALAVERRTSWAAADVEWAYDERGLWALQARPVTSLGGS